MCAWLCCFQTIFLSFFLIKKGSILSKSLSRIKYDVLFFLVQFRTFSRAVKINYAFALFPNRSALFHITNESAKEQMLIYAFIRRPWYTETVNIYSIFSTADFTYGGASKWIIHFKSVVEKQFQSVVEIDFFILVNQSQFVFCKTIKNQFFMNLSFYNYLQSNQFYYLCYFELD